MACVHVDDRLDESSRVTTPDVMVNVGALRSTLDRIRDGLARSSGVAALDLAGVMLHDRAGIPSRVRTVAEAARSTDMAARRGLAGFAGGYRDGAQARGSGSSSSRAPSS